MSTRIELTLACGDYEIMRALKEGTVKPDGIDLKVVTAMDLPTRHWRFLRGHEFEVAEVSSSSYIAARDNGHAFRAIPVFPHRRFRHGFAFVNTSKGIKTPKDLIGKKGRREVLSQQRGALAARHPPARIRRALQVHGLVHRTGRRRCRGRVPERPAAEPRANVEIDHRHAG